MLKYLLGIVGTMMLVGILIGGFGPQPEQRVLFDGHRWKLVEDYSTKQVCLFDKTEVEPPSCKPLQQRGANPFSPGMFPGEDPTDLPPPVPDTFPDEP